MKAFIVLTAILSVAIANHNVNWSEIKPWHVNPKVPGFPTEESHSRIVGGKEVKPHSLPYQVGLTLHMGSKSGWCGGSLISNQFVLTAAHCAQPADKVTVFLGAHNIKENEKSQIRIEVPKQNLIVHEQWDSKTLTNDIALIKLPNPIQFNENIKPVNLPRRREQQKNFVNENVLASGWGKDSDQAQSVSPVLRSVEAPVISKQSCNIRYFGVIKDSHICISGNGGKSTCNGDSGGPLVFTEKDGSKTLLGATSFGIALGCEKNWPAVFTRVTSYLDWISGKTGIKIRV